MLFFPFWKKNPYKPIPWHKVSRPTPYISLLRVRRNEYPQEQFRCNPYEAYSSFRRFTDPFTIASWHWQGEQILFALVVLLGMGGDAAIAVLEQEMKGIDGERIVYFFE
jgi:hypothetical protein